MSKNLRRGLVCFVVTFLLFSIFMPTGHTQETPPKDPKDRRFVFRPSCDKHNLFGCNTLREGVSRAVARNAGFCLRDHSVDVITLYANPFCVGKTAFAVFAVGPYATSSSGGTCEKARSSSHQAGTWDSSSGLGGRKPRGASIWGGGARGVVAFARRAGGGQRPKWERIRRTISESVIAATRRIWPPQELQTRGSTS